jgi:hypothetical protein
MCLQSDHLVAGEYGYWEVEQHENTHEVSMGMCVKMASSQAYPTLQGTPTHMGKMCLQP